MTRIVAAMLAALLAAAAYADAPKIKIERGTSCVLPSAEIRRDHMKVLLRQRDLTVHQGIRDPRFSLKNCVDCHASRETGSVLGKDGFCSSCHTYAAVSIDCFECHSPLRRTQAAARP
jgi:[DsrC]-trisulfide reductase subunit J